MKSELTPCPNCETKSKVISLHWSNSSDCKHPPIPQELQEVFAGIYAVRGSLSGRSPATGRQNFRVLLNQKEPLHELRDVFGVFGVDVRSQEKQSDWGGKVTQYQLASITHPAICEELLLDVKPTETFYKALTSVAGVRNAGGSYRLDLRPGVAKRRSDALDAVSSSKQRIQGDESRVNWNVGEIVRYYLPMRKVRGWDEIPWPSGWWNSEPYY